MEWTGRDSFSAVFSDETIDSLSDSASLNNAERAIRRSRTKANVTGFFIDTNGIGVVPKDVNLAPKLEQAVDVMIVSREIGLHGMAIMSECEGSDYDVPIESDRANLNFLLRECLKLQDQTQ